MEDKKEDVLLKDSYREKPTTAVRDLKALCAHYEGDYAKKVKPKSIRSILENEDKILRLYEIVEGRGKVFTRALVSSLILSEVELLNIKRDIQDADRLGKLADRIIDRFSGLTPPDIKLALMMGIEGHFGSILDRLDAGIVLDWMRQYFKLKKEHAQAFVAQPKEDGIPIPCPPEISRKIDEMHAKLTGTKSSGERNGLDFDRMRKERRAARELERQEREKATANGQTYETIEEYCEKNEVPKEVFLKSLTNQALTHLRNKGHNVATMDKLELEMIVDDHINRQLKNFNINELYQRYPLT